MVVIENWPRVKIALIACSRSNFHMDLAEGARSSVEHLAHGANIPIYACKRIVKDEQDAEGAVREAENAGCNAIAVLLGNFGPETPETLLAKIFSGPAMYFAASEDSKGQLYGGRRDSYCGMLNCSYNLELRGCRAYIPPYPVGEPEELLQMIQEFIPIARAALALRQLKLITFGPRPSDFFACNAPIKPLYRLGVEVQENSELDLLLAYQHHEKDSRISKIVEEMQGEVGRERYPDTLRKMAQYELTLLDWAQQNRGARAYVAFAIKCWPAFQQAFGFLPCYVHSRLMVRGIPVGCETDIYGVLSEYIGLCVSGQPVTLLDINNNLPQDVYDIHVRGSYAYGRRELFLGFHCGNTCSALLEEHKLTFKMNRKEPYAEETGGELTRGTLEGRLKPGEIACFRLHATAGGHLQSYIAQGEIIPVSLPTYGCYALFGVPEMDRFYRYVLLEKHFPHHSAIIYGQHASTLYQLMHYLGVHDIGYNHSISDRYDNEDPFLKRCSAE